MKAFRFVILLLIVVGALNWGMVGFFHFDVIAAIFGGAPKAPDRTAAERIVFAIVGLAGLYGVGFLCRCCGCKSSAKCKCGPKCKCCAKP